MGKGSLFSHNIFTWAGGGYPNTPGLYLTQLFHKFYIGRIENFTLLPLK